MTSTRKGQNRLTISSAILLQIKFTEHNMGIVQKLLNFCEANNKKKTLKKLENLKTH